MTVLNGNGPSLEAQMLYRQAIEIRGRGGYEQALTTLRKVVMIAPRFARAFYEMGNCLFELGRNREALAAYYKAFSLDPSYERIPEKLHLTVQKGGLGRGSDTRATAEKKA